MITFKEYLTNNSPKNIEEYNSLMEYQVRDELSANLAESLTNQQKESVDGFMSAFIGKNIDTGTKRILVVTTFIGYDKTPILQISEPMMLHSYKNKQFIFNKRGQKRAFPEYQDFGQYVRYYFLVKNTTEFDTFLLMTTTKWNKPAIKAVEFNNGMVI